MKPNKVIHCTTCGKDREMKHDMSHETTWSVFDLYVCPACKTTFVEKIEDKKPYKTEWELYGKEEDRDASR